ncbi:MAG: metallophosphoesterase family protein [Ignavibacteria bacterium]|nr:metallophosphoesterase family protein [Ignavibacteria bacterium]
MKLAIISDIHANLEALSKALHIIDSLAVDEIVCLGDMVDYGANPNECIELIRKHCSVVLLGNHDEAVENIQKAHSNFTELALKSTVWTNQKITDHNSIFLTHLPISCEQFGSKFVHSSPKDPAGWHYILSEYDAYENFRYFSTQHCFFGHSHYAEIFSNSEETLEPIRIENQSACSISEFRLNHLHKYLINVGSIGQPRDHDWRLSFGVFDTEQLIYRNYRAEYDVYSAAQKIRREKLPEHNARRLFVGK